MILSVSKKIAKFIFLAALVSLPYAGALAAGQSKVPSARVGKGNVVKLEIARTEAEITRGLMYRTSLPDDQGMVFLFHPSKPVHFWMYHTLIPLDMMFIRDGKITALMENVPPCRSEDPGACPVYPPGEAVDVSEVIEVNGGWARSHHVQKGDTVSFELP